MSNSEGLYIIATIVEPATEGWKNLGYKLLNYPACNCKLLSEESLLKLCKSDNLILKNARFENDKLVGTQGSLNRYTCLNAVDGKTINGNRVVILGKDSEGNFIVVQDCERCDGKKWVDTITEGSLLDIIGHTVYPRDKVFVANGKLKPVNDMQIQRQFMDNYNIVPIKGTYDIIKECPKFVEKVFDLSDTQRKYSPIWKVRIVKSGENYGRNYSVKNEGKSLVEFYDMSANKKCFPIGQFVSSYYLETLSEIGKHNGLKLYMDIPFWTLTKESYDIILNWLKHLKGV